MYVLKRVLHILKRTLYSEKILKRTLYSEKSITHLEKKPDILIRALYIFDVARALLATAGVDWIFQYDSNLLKIAVSRACGRHWHVKSPCLGRVLGFSMSMSRTVEHCIAQSSTVKHSQALIFTSAWQALTSTCFYSVEHCSTLSIPCRSTTLTATHCNTNTWIHFAITHFVIQWQCQAQSSTVLDCARLCVTLTLCLTVFDIDCRCQTSTRFTFTCHWRAWHSLANDLLHSHLPMTCFTVTCQWLASHSLVLTHSLVNVKHSQAQQYTAQQYTGLYSEYEASFPMVSGSFRNIEFFFRICRVLFRLCHFRIYRAQCIFCAWFVLDLSMLRREIDKEGKREK